MVYEKQLLRMLEIVVVIDVDVGNFDVIVVIFCVRDVLQFRLFVSMVIGDDLVLLQDIVRFLNLEFVSFSLMILFVFLIDVCYIFWIIKCLYYCFG